MQTLYRIVPFIEEYGWFERLVHIDPTCSLKFFLRACVLLGQLNDCKPKRPGDGLPHALLSGVRRFRQRLEPRKKTRFGVGEDFMRKNSLRPFYIAALAIAGVAMLGSSLVPAPRG